jgi:hypothetical protein
MAAPVGPILIGGLFAWGIYRRVRRNIGRQPLRPVRSIVSIVVLALVCTIIIFFSLHNPRSLAGLGGGIVLGIPLGFLGLRLTRFETTPEGHFYTPDTRIGVALSLLFTGRMIYRFWALRNVTTAAGQPQIFQSPLTLFIFGLIAGYYIIYRAGVLIHTRDRA